MGVGGGGQILSQGSAGVGRTRESYVQCHQRIERLHASFCHGNGGHFGAQLFIVHQNGRRTMAIANAATFLTIPAMCIIICSLFVGGGGVAMPQKWRGICS